MALPAGYSSEEDWDSGNELSFANSCENNVHKRNHTNEFTSINVGQKLINAVLNRRLDEVKILLENGVDVNYQPDFTNWPALMHAASLGHAELIELLLKYGANPNIHVKMTTPLICLCNSGNFDEDQLLNSLKLLLQSGAKTNVYDGHRITPLMYAAQRGHASLVSRLLELDVDLEVSDCEGWTALFYGVSSGNIKLVQALIDAGANVNLIDSKGQTLHDVASTRNFTDIANILIDDIVYSNELTKEMTSYQLVMSEMPNYQLSYFSGFCEDALNTVAGLDMKKIALLFRDNCIGYGHLLVNTDADWEKVGVKMSFDRKILTTFAKDIIKRKWSREAVVRDTDNINCLFTIDKILSNNIRIVHILVATYYVCQRELLTYNQIKDRHLFKEKLNNCLFEVKALRGNVNFVKSLFDKFEVSEKFPVDYIGPNSSYNFRLLRYCRNYRTLIYFIITFLGFHYLFKNPCNSYQKNVISWYLRLIKK